MTVTLKNLSVNFNIWLISVLASLLSLKLWFCWFLVSRVAFRCSLNILACILGDKNRIYISHVSRQSPGVALARRSWLNFGGYSCSHSLNFELLRCRFGLLGLCPATGAPRSLAGTWIGRSSLSRRGHLVILAGDRQEAPVGGSACVMASSAGRGQEVKRLLLACESVARSYLWVREETWRGLLCGPGLRVTTQSPYTCCCVGLCVGGQESQPHSFLIFFWSVSPCSGVCGRWELRSSGDCHPWILSVLHANSHLWFCLIHGLGK